MANIFKLNEYEEGINKLVKRSQAEKFDEQENNNINDIPYKRKSNSKRYIDDIFKLSTKPITEKITIDDVVSLADKITQNLKVSTSNKNIFSHIDRIIDQDNFDYKTLSIELNGNFTLEIYLYSEFLFSIGDKYKIIRFNSNSDIFDSVETICTNHPYIKFTNLPKKLVVKSTKYVENCIDRYTNLQELYPVLYDIFSDKELKENKLYLEILFKLSFLCCIYTYYKIFHKMQNIYENKVNTMNFNEYLYYLAILIQYKCITENGAIVEYDVDDNTQLGRVLYTKYFTDYKPEMEIVVEYVCFDDGNIVNDQKTIRILNRDGGKINIKDLNVRPYIEEYCKKDYNYYVERGKKYMELCSNINYCDYKGYMKKLQSEFIEVADGRIVVDCINKQLLNNRNPYMYRNSNNCYIHKEELSLERSKRMLEMLYPFFPSTVLGYSIRNKDWGVFNIDNIEKINFNKNCINDLVMREDFKQIILDLSKERSNFRDIVQDKEGGNIFLLQGNPGTGKTLTSEVVSEYLEKPLYPITVGELGYTTTDIENNLKNILNLAESWNAILLIDEADIFLEKRSSETSIERNSIVGIFLRLLEHYKGIMFITTNRSTVIDPAILSRMSIIINYDDLSPSTRSQIWKILFRINDIEVNDIDIEKWSTYNVDGRRIKSIVKNAMTIYKANETRGVNNKISEIIYTLLDMFTNNIN